MVADRQPAPARRQRIRVGPEEPPQIRRVLERRIEVDVVRDLERQVQGHGVDRCAWPIVCARGGERLCPRFGAERHQRIERGLLVDVTECREVDDVVAVAPAESRRPACDREDAVAAHRIANATLPPGRAPCSGSLRTASDPGGSSAKHSLPGVRPARPVRSRGCLVLPPSGRSRSPPSASPSRCRCSRSAARSPRTTQRRVRSPPGIRTSTSTRTRPATSCGRTATTTRRRALRSSSGRRRSISCCMRSAPCLRTRTRTCAIRTRWPGYRSAPSGRSASGRWFCPRSDCSSSCAVRWSGSSRASGRPRRRSSGSGRSCCRSRRSSSRTCRPPRSPSSRSASSSAVGRPTGASPAQAPPRGSRSRSTCRSRCRPC